MPDFKKLLTDLHGTGDSINVSFSNSEGYLKVKIDSIIEDIVTLSLADEPARKIFMHYTAVIIIT